MVLFTIGSELFSYRTRRCRKLSRSSRTTTTSLNIIGRACSHREFFGITGMTIACTCACTKKKVLTCVLDTQHQVHYVIIDSSHAWSRSRSTEIREVAGWGKSDEHDLPV